MQLTEFADKSYALGLSCTHIHNDPTAAALFFQAWAAAHRRTTSTYPPFLHAPAFEVSPASPPPAPPLLAEKSGAASPASADAAAMSSATFHFPAPAVRALLSSLEPRTTRSRRAHGGRRRSCSGAETQALVCLLLCPHRRIAHSMQDTRRRRGHDRSAAACSPLLARPARRRGAAACLPEPAVGAPPPARWKSGRGWRSCGGHSGGERAS